MRAGRAGGKDRKRQAPPKRRSRKRRRSLTTSPTARTADAINDFFIKTATNAARPLLAKRPKDEEEWVIKAVHK